ncbi:ribonuclease domain-containing protein [Gordonia humi]|uniref:Guanyl-specific ribonuclease Sa n=1 Tax=Gordonia humi TaxID=686429 RepID=A0A840F5J9_9ACTN|nr:ribonuclease domain-containing protein [Gordonia humi]MBB4137934.1 guanyl-specific ribonuclease Sa [Gordonia humi]
MSASNSDPDQSRRRLLASGLGVVVLLAVVALTWWVDGRSSLDSVESTSSGASIVAPSATGSEHSRTAGKPSDDVPARVQQTLDYIDAGDWPEAANAPGTHGGDLFRNAEGRLPRRTADGQKITYREWDVNAKQRGRGRDAERIVTGSNGSAYYTLDHYESFTAIRGPAA